MVVNVDRAALARAERQIKAALYWTRQRHEYNTISNLEAAYAILQTALAEADASKGEVMTQAEPSAPRRMDVTLYHKQQPEPIGCMYYAVWAFTKDDSLLEHVRDLGEGRFRKRLAERGILLTAMFEGRYSHKSEPLESETWERIRSHAQYEGWPRLGLLAIIPSPRVQGNHMVAVQIQSRRHGAHVHVSDSALPDILEMTWVEFLKSPYAQAVAILRPDQDFPGRVDAYPLSSGRS